MIGIDLELVKRFELKKTDSFILRTFTANEIKYAFSKTKPAMHLAGTFCVKEAYMKAIGRAISFLNVEVLREKSGQPILQVKNEKRNIEISISHTQSHAIAVVLISKK